MPSTISAGTTAGTAIAIAGDTTGNLAFQTNGTTTAMTIDTNQVVGIGTTTPLSWTKLQLNGTAGAQTLANQQLNIVAPTTTVGQGAGIRLSAASGAKEAVGVIGMVNEASGNLGALTFHTYNGGATIPEYMRIDSAGRVTTPNQPGCLVGKTNGNVAAQNIVVFDQIIYNVGSHYNNSNGRFTAPVAGYYYVSASGLGTTSAGVEVSIRRNGAVVVNTRGGGASGYTSASSSAIIYANANDYFDYRTEGAYTVDGGSGYPYTGMCVYLIG